MDNSKQAQVSVHRQAMASNRKEIGLGESCGTSLKQKTPVDTEKIPSKEIATRIPTMEERMLQKEQVIDLYKSLEQFLRSEDFGEDVKKVLQKSHPKYLEVLEKRRNDMQRSDHAIVIAGETSAGKSTLINKILGKRIFQGDNLESTSTICKIRNSEKITLIVEHKSGKTETRDLTDKCDMETQEGIRTLRKILNDLTNLTDSTKSKEYKNVDIGFPIPFLKDGVILVDTPGIGGSGEVSDKVMEYLPNAVSFVFVINVGSAGGMQKDRENRWRVVTYS
uniref:Uncharacterized protein LOC111117580 isoform X6 n=1 Tax=Crassostrea virginica TaxID=6565 RepID=A0A8B8C9L2_CRAVI|nr:uncharacterized protein LOC111117580 isoform X6 [Crassostrea virginica]